MLCAKNTQALDALKEKYTLSDQFAKYKTRGWVSTPAAL